MVWLVRKRRNMLRIPVILLSSPAALLACLLIVLQVLTRGCESYSNPLYSPSHTKLVRVSTFDAGALGGNSAVELLTHRGFSSTYIYRGSWRSVDLAEDVRWLDDNHIAIQYDPYGFGDCVSTRSVSVQCTKKIRPVPTGTLPSPDGHAVAELHTAKDGSWHGTDAVELTGPVGFAFVYVGEPNSVVWTQTRWRSNGELVITTRSSPTTCADQIGIKVTCVPIQLETLGTHAK